LFFSVRWIIIVPLDKGWRNQMSESGTSSKDMLVAVFPSRAILTRALDHLKTLDYLDIEHAAIVAKAHSGEIVILDDDISADEGGIAGGTLAAAMTAFGLVQLGALALPGVGPIIALGAGALVGGLVGRATGRFAANLLDFGFRNEQIDALAAQLQSGRPALILEVKDYHKILPRLSEDLKQYRAELLTRRHDTGKLLPP
jgi:uncharacterized membrane protein